MMINEQTPPHLFLGFGFAGLVIVLGVADDDERTGGCGRTLAGRACDATYVNGIIVGAAEPNLETDGLERRRGRERGRGG